MVTINLQAYNKVVNVACGWTKHCALCPLPWRYASQGVRVFRYISLEAKNLETGEIFARRCKALDHPRTLMGGFNGEEACITEALNTLAPKKFLLPRSIIYIHLLDKVEGGVTNAEVRVFREAAIVGGAREIHVPRKEKLISFSQLKSKNIKSVRCAHWDNYLLAASHYSQQVIVAYAKSYVFSRS